jgi:hypothetical protein
MLSIRKIIFLMGLAAACSVSLFADDQIIGRLIKASQSGVDTTKRYEPLVTITQTSILGVQNFTLQLSGIRPPDSKRYEFYRISEDNGDNNVIWKRRTRDVTVTPLNAYITINEGQDNTSTIVLNYEYRGRKGFGNVVYVIAVER